MIPLQANSVEIYIPWVVVSEVWEMNFTSCLKAIFTKTMRDLL